MRFGGDLDAVQEDLCAEIDRAKMQQKAFPAQSRIAVAPRDAALERAPVPELLVGFEEPFYAG